MVNSLVVAYYRADAPVHYMIFYICNKAKGLNCSKFSSSRVLTASVIFGMII